MSSNRRGQEESDSDYGECAVAAQCEQPCRKDDCSEPPEPTPLLSCETESPPPSSAADAVRGLKQQVIEENITNQRVQKYSSANGA